MTPNPAPAPDRPLLFCTDPRLSMPSVRANDIPAAAALADEMLRVLADSGGIGLAANQIGDRRSVIVIDLEGEQLVLINPRITWRDGEQSLVEGCLSVPGARVRKTRAKTVTVAFTDRDGGECVRTADGLLAACIQHEMDHLAGRTILDGLSALKKSMAFGRLKKWRASQSKTG